MSSEGIIEIKTIEELLEMASMGGGAAHGHSNNKQPRRKKMKKDEQLGEKLIRMKIRKLLINEIKKSKSLITEQEKRERIASYHQTITKRGRSLGYTPP